MQLRWVVLILAALILTGCAASSDRSDDQHNRFGGFYGGVNGGVVP